jgi:hypothetical protein
MGYPHKVQKPFFKDRMGQPVLYGKTLGTPRLRGTLGAPRPTPLKGGV